MVEIVGPYKFTITHIGGIDNYWADSLSRQDTYAKTRLNDQLLYDEVENEQFIPPNMEVRKVEGGPNSLFISLIEASKRTELKLPDSINELRTRLVEEILKNPTRYQIADTRDNKDKLKLMKSPTMSPYLEVCQALTDIYKCRILMYFGTDKPMEFTPYTDPKQVKVVTPLLVQSLGQGCHYNHFFKLRLDQSDEKKIETVFFSTRDPYIVEEPSKSEKVNMEHCAAAGQDSFNLQRVNSLPRQAYEEVSVNRQAKLDHTAAHNTKYNSDIEIRLPSYQGCKKCMSGHFRSDLMIKDHQDQFHCILCDSGASFSMITLSFLTVLSNMKLVYWAKREDQPPIYGIGDSKIIPLGKALVKIPLTNNYEVIPVTVCEDAHLGHCLLLGGNVLTSLGIIIDYVPDQRIFRYRDNELKVVNKHANQEFNIYYTTQLQEKDLKSQNDNRTLVNRTSHMTSCYMTREESIEDSE
jgi:hypothetical protein